MRPPVLPLALAAAAFAAPAPMASAATIRLGICNGDDLRSVEIRGRIPFPGERGHECCKVSCHAACERKQGAYEGQGDDDDDDDDDEA